LKIQVIGFRAHQKNSLHGFVDLALGSSGLIVHDCIDARFPMDAVPEPDLTSDGVEPEPPASDDPDPAAEPREPDLYGDSTGLAAAQPAAEIPDVEHPDADGASEAAPQPSSNGASLDVQPEPEQEIPEQELPPPPLTLVRP
jgi:hypothetical protein